MSNKIAHTIRETTEAVGLGRSKLYQLIKSGEIKCFHVGKRTLIADDDLQNFLRKCRGAK